MSRDNELWMSLDALAASYERAHSTRPNKLRVGRATAEALEPGHGAHPVHLAWESPVPGVWFPERPAREARWWDQVRRQWNCRKAGGHWWHPADPMILWFCCRCGADRDGMPEDGT